ncbi:MAG: hypothetical protein F6K28_24755 [Microcoleus sp. SIO2G3]|nr:hypothetical protein [Microcoleus sp. SIO2G3]
MTNFFTQLAGRTLGLTPIVQPRIDSMFVPEVGSEAIVESASASAKSATPESIAPSHTSLTANSPLVNSDRPTLPIAHAPRSIAPAIGHYRTDQAVSDQSDVRSILDIYPAGDRGVPDARSLPETNFASLDRAASPPAMPQESNLSTPSQQKKQPSTAPPDVILSEDSASTVLPKVPVSSAIEPNRLQARSNVERASDQLQSSHAIDSANLPSISPDRVDAAQVLIKNAAQTVSQTERILVDREVRHEQTIFTPPPPSIQPIDRAEQQPASTVPPVVVPRQAATLLPIVTPRLERSQRPEEKAAPPPPTIQVTIGRIEVRAVPPPAPPRPRVTTPPARLSLEDYLRSRSGGER